MGAAIWAFARLNWTKIAIGVAAIIALLFIVDAWNTYQDTRSALAQQRAVNEVQKETIKVLTDMAALEKKLTDRNLEYIRQANASKLEVQKSLDNATRDLRRIYTDAKKAQDSGTVTVPYCAVDPGVVDLFDRMRRELRPR